MKHKKIETLKELLQKASSENGLDCYIKLTSGLKSSKFITYDKEEDSITISHMIDGSREEITLNEFMDSNTIIALEKECLYEHEDFI